MKQIVIDIGTVIKYKYSSKLLSLFISQRKSNQNKNLYKKNKKKLKKKNTFAIFCE